jgi:hypothetical protein
MISGTMVADQGGAPQSRSQPRPLSFRILLARSENARLGIIGDNSAELMISSSVGDGTPPAPQPRERAKKKWASVPSGIARPFLGFAFGLKRVVSHAHPCEALSGLQQFNVEIASRLAMAFFNLAHV